MQNFKTSDKNKLFRLEDSLDKAQSLASYYGLSIEGNNDDVDGSEGALGNTDRRRRWKPPRNLVSLNDYMHSVDVESSICRSMAGSYNRTVLQRISGNQCSNDKSAASNRFIKKGFDDIATPSHRMESMFDWCGVKDNTYADISNESDSSAGLTEYALILNSATSYSDDESDDEARRAGGLVNITIPSSQHLKSKSKDTKSSRKVKKVDKGMNGMNGMNGMFEGQVLNEILSPISPDAMPTAASSYWIVPDAYSTIEGIQPCSDENNDPLHDTIDGDNQNGSDLLIGDQTDILENADILGYRGVDSSSIEDVEEDTANQDINIYLDLKGEDYQILGLPLFTRPDYNFDWMEVVSVEKTG